MGLSLSPIPHLTNVCFLNYTWCKIYFPVVYWVPFFSRYMVNHSLYWYHEILYTIRETLCYVQAHSMSWNFLEVFHVCSYFWKLWVVTTVKTVYIGYQRLWIKCMNHEVKSACTKQWYVICSQMFVFECSHLLQSTKTPTVPHKGASPLNLHKEGTHPKIMNIISFTYHLSSFYM